MDDVEARDLVKGDKSEKEDKVEKKVKKEDTKDVFDRASVEVWCFAYSEKSSRAQS